MWGKNDIEWTDDVHFTLILVCDISVNVSSFSTCRTSGYYVRQPTVYYDQGFSSMMSPKYDEFNASESVGNEEKSLELSAEE